MQRLLRIRDLDYFIAVAERRSFARAADALGVTQPTLSNQVRKIEETLDCRLFRRTGRLVALTPEGERVLEHARQVVIAFNELERETLDGGVFAGGPLRFGAIPTLTPYLGAPLLTRIRAEHQGGSVSFVEAVTEELERGVALGELDFAVTATLPKDPDLRARRIVTERLSFLTLAPPDGDPFKVDAASAPNRPILLMHEAHCFREAVYASIARVNAALTERVDYSVGPASLATLISMVRGGVGDSVAPAPFAAAAVASFPDVHALPLDPELFQRGLQVIFRVGRERRPDLDRVCDLAAEVYADLSEPAASA